MPKPKIDYSQAIEPLRMGRLAVIPTDTIYGLVCSALHPPTIRQLYEARGRMLDKPSIVLIAGIEDLQLFSIVLTAEMNQRVGSYWPGPVTIILPAPSSPIPYVSGTTDTISFRMPEDGHLRGLLQQTGPLVAPSANLEGQLPATTIKEAKAYFNDRVSIYVDGGSIVGSPSKIITLEADGSEHVIRA